MNRKQFGFVLCSVVLALSLSLLGMQYLTQSRPTFAQYRPVYQIILDPGHGGMDGGAVGVNQVVEKEINLSIAKKLETLLILQGFQVIMTRSSDISLHDPNILNQAQQKRDDMYQRLHLMETYPAAIFVSIHQNKFPQSSCRGAQIFYSLNDPHSAILADFLQESFRLLQPNNQREIKASGEELFLLYHAKVPAVMVECGFISNPEECTQLLDEEYQKKLAFTIFHGIADYIMNQSERQE